MAPPTHAILTWLGLLLEMPTPWWVVLPATVLLKQADADTAQALSLVDD